MENINVPQKQGGHGENFQLYALHTILAKINCIYMETSTWKNYSTLMAQTSRAR